MTVVICPHCSTELPAHFKFCGECGVRLPARGDTGNAPSIRQDEFRDVTILFADVTGFTALSEKLDPEAVHEMMNACFDGLGRIIQAHGGHIDKYIGDSIMALFGAPTAHEDDPVRAAESAIEMQAFVAEFANRQHSRVAGSAPFKMRIGLNCGTVVAGAVGAAVRRDYSVMGDAVNVASRLESNAEPGTILASADFKRRVGEAFAFGPARLVHLKGKERPIEAYVLEGERVTAAMPATEDESGAVIGRTSELALVNQALSQSGSRPPWIEVRGPLGIGKSRLAEAALAKASARRALHVISRSTTAARPFALMRRLLQAIYQEATGDAALPQSRQAFVAALGKLAEGLDPYLNAIWFIAAPDALGLKSPDPDPLTYRLTLERGLSALLANLSRLAPAPVLVLDAYDVADGETRNFLERVHQTASAQMPAVITTVRSETPPAAGATCVVELAGLDEAASHQLVASLSADLPLSAGVAGDIVRRSSGVPLFIKELVRKVQDDGAGGEPAASAARTTAALPSSLLGVMLSHLDRLEANERNFLGHCAVQGSEFSAGIAACVWAERGGDGTEVPSLIAGLARRNLVAQLSAGSDRWTFAQELMQNACYDRMLRRDRRELHRGVAGALIDTAGGEQGVSPELLATHYENGELWLKAAQQNVRAGDRAADIFANSDALARYARAARALQELAEGTAETRFCAFAASRGAALVHLRVGNYAGLKDDADRMLTVADDALAEAEAVRLKAQGFMHGGDLNTADAMLRDAESRIGPPPAPGRGSGSCASVRARLAYDHADVCYRLGRNSDAAGFIASCRRLCDPAATESIRLDILDGRLAHTEGRFEQATSLYERAYRAAQKAGSLSEEALTSNCMGNAARDSGRYAEAETHFLRALEVWGRTGNTEAIAGAHNNLANLAISRGDQVRASHHYSEALSAFDKIGNTAGRAIALMNLAILAIELGEPERAIDRAEVACSVLQSSGNRVLWGLARVIKGEALVDAARLPAASDVFSGVLDDYTEANHPLALAGAHRGFGRIYLAAGRTADAIGTLERALGLFERLKRVQEAGRTEVHIAKAYEFNGDTAACVSFLERALAKFTAIGASRDVERTEALLQNLRLKLD